jgi:uncharacterized membrane protein
MFINCYIYVKRVLTLSINQNKYRNMKKILLVLMMVTMVIPSFAGGGKGKKKHKQQNTTEVTTPVRPVHRERWIEKQGDYYVIVSRTTITEEDYRRIRNTNR